MPILVVSLIRVIIQASVTTGLLITIQWLISPLTDAAKWAVQKAFNMTDDEAQDTIANEIIDTFATMAILGVAIKSKIPTIAAEKLGFTTKGYYKRPVSKKLPAGVQGSAAKLAVTGKTAVVLSATEAYSAVSAAKITLTGFKVAYDAIFKLLGISFLGLMVVGNFLDFGNWNSGAYQKTFQKIFAYVTGGLLVPDEDYRKTKTASPEVFNKVYNTYKIGGAVGIIDSFKKQSVPFTRDNLIDLIDQVGAILLLTTKQAATKDVLLASQAMIIFDLSVDVDAVLGSSAPVASYSVPTASVAPITKVFTGIVSQGVVGAGLSFEARQDDMIQSAEELRSAAANNLALFLAALPAKIVYEVKVVSSIITKEGFRISGTTQQIKNGTYQNGEPKYKVVTNKFAQLIIFALTDKGSRTKLTTIVLGPTDSAKLQVAQSDLRALENALPAMVTTSDINEITGIATSNPITVSTPATETKTVTVTSAAGGIPIKAEDDAPAGASRVERIDGQLYYWPSDVKAVTVTKAAPGANANNLYEWYQSQGQLLPSIAVRGRTYQGLGLGQAAYYTGTGEQNTKLLAALKKLTEPPPVAATTTKTTTKTTTTRPTVKIPTTTNKATSTTQATKSQIAQVKAAAAAIAALSKQLGGG